MKNTKHTLNFSPRTKLRLSEIRRIIVRDRIIIPPLSLRVLREMCDDGRLECAGRFGRDLLVFEDSFLEWVKSLDQPRDLQTE